MYDSCQHLLPKGFSHEPKDELSIVIFFVHLVVRKLIVLLNQKAKFLLYIYEYKKCILT